MAFKAPRLDDTLSGPVPSGAMDSGSFKYYCRAGKMGTRVWPSLIDGHTSILMIEGGLKQLMRDCDNTPGKYLLMLVGLGDPMISWLFTNKWKGMQVVTTSYKPLVQSMCMCYAHDDTIGSIDTGVTSAESAFAFVRGFDTQGKEVMLFGIEERKGKVNSKFLGPIGGNVQSEPLIEALLREIHEESGLVLDTKQVKQNTYWLNTTQGECNNMGPVNRTNWTMVIDLRSFNYVFPATFGGEVQTCLMSYEEAMAAINPNTPGGATHQCLDSVRDALNGIGSGVPIRMLFRDVSTKTDTYQITVASCVNHQLLK
jgi:hypothetical protein